MGRRLIRGLTHRQDENSGRAAARPYESLIPIGSLRVLIVLAFHKMVL
jgi:hypothetical protein